MNIQYFLAPKSLTRNHISCSVNVLKINYSNVKFQNFPREDPRTPRFKGRGGKGRGEGGKEGERRGGKGVRIGEVAPWAFLRGWTLLRPETPVYSARHRNDSRRMMHALPNGDQLVFLPAYPLRSNKDLPMHITYLSGASIGRRCCTIAKTVNSTDAACSTVRVDKTVYRPITIATSD